MSLDGRLAAKGAGVAGVLADFHPFSLAYAGRRSICCRFVIVILGSKGDGKGE